MTGAIIDVQAALFTALAADGGVQALLGAPSRLYDHVPPDAAFPYATFGAQHIAPYDAKTETGFEQTITLDIWSRYRGGKEARDILQAFYDALHRASLVVASEVFLLCEFQDADVTPLDDGLTTHIAARFTVVTQAG